MALLNPQALPHEFPRHYVPASTDLGHWPSVEPLLKELLNRAVGSPADLEKWLKDHGELVDALNEEGSARYIRMTCQTDDPELEKKYLEFLEKIEEPSKPLFFALSKKYWESSFRTQLPEKNY